MDQEEAPWVVDGIGWLSSIKKYILNLQEKAWCTLVGHKLSLNLSNNIVVSDKSALIAGIILGYEIDVDKWISWDIRDREMSTNMMITFPCLLTQYMREYQSSQGLISFLGQ